MPIKKLVIQGGAVLVVAAVAFSFLGIGPRKVTLEHHPQGPCATTDPAEPEIFKDKLKNFLKPKKVKWVVADEQKNEYLWKVTYQATSGTVPEKMGTGNYLGPVNDIQCTGPQSTKSKKAPKNGSDDLQWPYKIGVYDCDGVLICEQDPIIWIQD